MISRRTWARVVFVSNVLVLPLRVYQWRRSNDEDGQSVSLVPRWLVAGFAYRVGYYWAHDRDIGDIRTNLRHRALSSLFRLLLGVGLTLGLRTSSRSESLWYSLSTGESAGQIVYRLWYGVLRPLPGTDE